MKASIYMSFCHSSCRGWYEIIDLLALNGVKMRRLTKDTMITMEAYCIEDYQSYPRAYEKRDKNTKKGE